MIPITPHTDDIMRRPYPGAEEHYTICAALREIYIKVDDPEIKLKLRYASTLAHCMVDELEKCNPGWVKTLYPKKSELKEIMKEV